MIDHHCHPFALEPGPLDLGAVTLDHVEGPAAETRRNRLRPTFLWHELLRTRLAAHLGCGVGEVDAARRDAAEGDYRGYVRGLFSTAGIEELIVDAAWSTDPQREAELLEDLSGCRAHLIFRVETVIDELLAGDRTYEEVVAAFDDALEGAVESGHCGFKTVIAYRTGLAIDPDVAVEAARMSLSGEGPVRRRGKATRDLLARRMLGFAADHNLPVQFHTGLGDSDLRLSDANPLLLEDLLRTPEGSGPPIVLIHGSFPYHEEAAFLCATRPNVYVDFSLFNLFAPAGVADRLLRLIDLAPTAKLLAGTDGHLMPETHWFAATVAQDAWTVLAGRLGEQGVASAWLNRARDAIFAENARELYGL